MLWTAGQERVAREKRSRMAELFAAARDAALDVGVSSGQLKARGAWRLPSYIDVDRSERPQTLRTPAERDMALASLGAQFPGIVRRADS